MKTSAAGIAAIRQREGCELHAYYDTAGVATIGVGHTGRMTPPAVRMGDVITLEQADAYLAADIAPFEQAINEVITVPMTQNQFDAMVSLAFNIGVHGFSGSTVVARFNAHNIEGAADAFLMWEKPPELKKRREGERLQFLTVTIGPENVAKTTPIPFTPGTSARVDRAKVEATTEEDIRRHMIEDGEDPDAPLGPPLPPPPLPQMSEAQREAEFWLALKLAMTKLANTDWFLDLVAKLKTL